MGILTGLLYRNVRSIAVWSQEQEQLRLQVKRQSDERISASRRNIKDMKRTRGRRRIMTMTMKAQ